MELQVASDLHLEFGPIEWSETDADLVILAGDIHTKNRALDWIETTFVNPRQSVLYVFGNHEYYGSSYPNIINAAYRRKIDRLHILNNSTYIQEDIAFIGSTLWTDFNLYNNQPLAMIDAPSHVNDYKLIRVAPNYRKIQPNFILKLHKDSIEYITQQLYSEDLKDKRKVVISHFLPTSLSIAPRYKNDPANICYASEYTALIQDAQPLLWIHAHTHESLDYYIGDTRIVCNPYGYRGKDKNSNYNPTLTIKV